jgi:ferredoxin
MKLVARPEKCVGAGQCVTHAPAVFDQDGNGIVELQQYALTGADMDAVETAVMLCPSGAIAFEED